jgi:hypothetical protein
MAALLLHDPPSSGGYGVKGPDMPHPGAPFAIRPSGRTHIGSVHTQGGQDFGWIGSRPYWLRAIA